MDVVRDPHRSGLVQPFSPARVVGDLVLVSGQACVDERGAHVEASFEVEMRSSMDALGRILAAAGCAFDDVVQTRCYLGTYDHRDEFNRLYLEYFRAPLPARTTTAGGIGPLKFEIDAIAVRPGAAR
jgi:2-iminobutanoate/2-iminopropanoate deaminase